MKTKFLSKEEITNNKVSMSALILAGGTSAKDSVVDSVTCNCLRHVVFAIHPQQINVRDKANGMIIAVLRR